MAWVLLGVLAGFMVPWQTVANNRLRLSTGTPYSASLVSFSVGTAGLIAVCLVLGLLSDATLAISLPKWMWLGGAFGVVALTGNILLFPRLGAVETVVLPIAGQILIGLVIDQFGWFHAPVQHLTLIRGLGAAVVMAGVLACVGRPVESQAPRGAWGWRAAGIVFGALIACQAAVNGQLGKALGSPIPAALISFAVGTALLLVVNAALRWRPRAERVDERPNPWWMWLGGFIGATYVLVNAALAPLIGTGLTVMAGLAGLMAGSLLVDRVFVRGTRLAQVVGVLLILGGVAAMRLI